MHHSFRHHTYTGNPDLDPDMIHTDMKPAIRKNSKTIISQYIKVPKSV